MPAPDFSDTALFPAFADLPAELPPDEASAAETTEAWFLVAQIKADMTITKPTLVLTDRAGAEFALVFEGAAPHHGGPGGTGTAGLDLRGRGLRKGCTVVVPRARRATPRGQAGQGFVRVLEGGDTEVRALPGGWERVLGVASRMREREREREQGNGKRACENCGTGAAAEGDDVPLMKCTGCGEAKYCSKECQAKGWSEGGHKLECKIIQAIEDIWRRTS